MLATSGLSNIAGLRISSAISEGSIVQAFLMRLFCVVGAEPGL